MKTFGEINNQVLAKKSQAAVVSLRGDPIKILGSKIKNFLVQSSFHPVSSTSISSKTTLTIMNQKIIYK
jgi:hypothetical protein